MPIKRAPVPSAPDPPLDEQRVLLLLLGYDKSDLRRGPFIQQLAFCRTDPGNQRAIAALWGEHQTFLVDEATRLGIARRFYPDSRFYPAGGILAFFAEYVAATVEQVDRHDRGNDDDLPA